MHIWIYAFYKDLLFWWILHFRINVIRQSLPFKAILFGNFIGTQRSYALKEMNICNEALCPERARQDDWTSRWLPRSGIQISERPNRFCLNATNFKGKKYHLSSHNIVLHLIFMKTTIQEEYFLPASAYSSV